MHNRGTCVVPFFNNIREQNVLEKEELQRLIWRVSLIMSIVTLRIEYMEFKKKKIRKTLYSNIHSFSQIPMMKIIWSCVTFSG